MNRMTLHLAMQQRQQQIQDRVTEKTGLGRDQIMALMFETGAEYIEQLAGAGTISNDFLKEPIYWSWWKQQWALLDESFLAQVPDGLSRRQKALVYKEWHRLVDITPDPVIWDRIHSSYERMSREIIKKHTSKNKQTT